MVDTAWRDLPSDITPTLSHFCVSASYFQISSRSEPVQPPRSASSVWVTYQWPHSYPSCTRCSAYWPLSTSLLFQVMLPPLSTGLPHRSQCWRESNHWNCILRPQGKSKSNNQNKVWVLICVLPEHCLWRRRSIHDQIFLCLTGLGPPASLGRCISTPSWVCYYPPW